MDRRAKGRGLGTQLLMHAIERVGDVSESIGCVGIDVDAKDERALGFYVGFGFVPLSESGFPRRAFLPMRQVRALLED